MSNNEILKGNNKKTENTMSENTNVDKGIALAEMDTTVRPQDDFYNYVNGTWAKTAQIPADKPTWGSFHILREKTDENCLLILDNLLKENFEQGTEGQKIKDLYESFIDWNKRIATLEGWSTGLCLDYDKVLIAYGFKGMDPTEVDAGIKAFGPNIPAVLEIIFEGGEGKGKLPVDIPVIKDGKLNSYGNHEELLKSSELYKEMYAANLRGDENA